MPIGKIVIDLEAQYAAFSKGVSEVKHGVGEIGESLESLKGLVEGAFAFAGIEVGVGAIKEMVGHTMEATAQANRLSGSLGITTESLQKLQTAGLLGAGVKADEFDGIMQKLTKSLGGAEEGGGKAGEVLKQLGLDGDALKGAHVDEAFTKIATEIGKVQDPTQRARDEITLFGKTGQQLDPLFREGAEGIAKAGEEATRLGIAMNETDNAKIMAANESFEKMGLAVQGVENQLTIALAPVMQTVLDKILSIVPTAQAMQSGFLTALKYVAEGIGYVEDAWQVMKLGGQAVSLAIVGYLDLVINEVDALAKGIVWVANKLGAHIEVPAFITDTTAAVDAWRQQIQSDMGDTMKSLQSPQSEKWGKFFDDVQNKANDTAKAMADSKNNLAQPITADFEESAKKVDSILQGMQQQVATFGMDEGQKKVAEITAAGGSPEDIAKAKALADQLETMTKQKAVSEDLSRLAKEAAQFGMTAADKQLDDLKGKGASQEQIAQARALDAQIEKMNAWKKEQEEANQLIKESMTPQEKYQEQIDKVQKLFKDGLITAQQQSDAIAKADSELNGKDKPEKDGKEKHDHVDKLASTSERRFDFRLPTKARESNDPADKQLKVSQQSAKSLEEIAKNTGQKPKVASLR